jgi:NADH-quinone oxidoreductase subunit G
LISRYWSPGWNSVQALNKFQSEIPGPLRSGDPGACLADRMKKTDLSFFTEIPPATIPGDNQWWLVGLYHVFGSEELSSLSPGIAYCSPDPYVALHPDDGKALGTNEGDTVAIIADDRKMRLPVRLMPGLAKKVAGLPVGVPGIPVLNLPVLVTLAKGSKE